MGREIRRVPLDFKWPINTVWGGFINPFYKQSIECPECGGNGESKEAQKISNRWHNIDRSSDFKPEDRGSKPFLPDHPTIQTLAKRNVPSLIPSDVAIEANRLCSLFNSQWCHHLNQQDVDNLVKDRRLIDFTHNLSKEHGWQPKNPPYTPTAEEVNNWSLCGLTHDSINKHIVVKEECKRLGIEFFCAACKGDGIIWPTEKIKRQCDRWKCTDPPNGDGYQLWETVSEGSPISPVFANPEDLADWLTESPEYKWKRNDQGVTREQWLNFIKKEGYAMSLIISENGIQTGVQAFR